MYITRIKHSIYGILIIWNRDVPNKQACAGQAFCPGFGTGTESRWSGVPKRDTGPGLKYPAGFGTGFGIFYFDKSYGNFTPNYLEWLYTSFTTFIKRKNWMRHNRNIPVPNRDEGLDRDFSGYFKIERSYCQYYNKMYMLVSSTEMTKYNIFIQNKA